MARVLCVDWAISIAKQRPATVKRHAIASKIVRVCVYACVSVRKTSVAKREIGKQTNGQPDATDRTNEEGEKEREIKYTNKNSLASIYNGKTLANAKHTTHTNRDKPIRM